MGDPIKVLSDITVHMKYARFLPEKGRRETWEEIVNRNMEMHIRKFPKLEKEIRNNYKFVFNKKVLPSMRSLQFGGKPIEVNPARLFNCCFLPINHIDTFSETMFLLLGGTGVGYSVQKHHIEQLPELKGVNRKRKRRYLVADSIEGWADAIKVLIESYFKGKSEVVFDFSDIRPKGAQLITAGGKAPGAQPLKDCIHNIRKILDAKEINSQLDTIEAHDIECHIADAVLSGGIRRAALISLFSANDEKMISCKAGNWWELNSQRGRANNSAVLLRSKITEEAFLELWKKIELSGSGEPGIYFSEDKDWGTNPSLRAGTRVFTTEGIFPIEELQDKEFYVKNLNGRISKAKCWLSGKNKKLYEVTLKGGHKYYATPEHEWAVETSEGVKKFRTDALKVGQKFPFLRESYQFEGELGNYDDGFFIGWQIGDGGTHTRKDTGVTQHNLIVSKKDGLGVKSKLESYLKDYLELEVKFRERGECFELNTSSKKWNNLQDKFGYTVKNEGLPKATWKGGSESFRKGLIDGIFSSDGYVETGKKRISFCSKHERLVKDVSDILGFYGIKSSIKSTNRNGFNRFDLRITENKSILQFRKLFKLTTKHKQDRLNSYEFPYNIKEKDNIEVIDVKKSDVIEDVWDISVQDHTHCFQLAHSITGNCCEIALRPFQFCNLTEVNASNIESEQDFFDRVKAASFIGTLQASYTNFHYLRSIWQRNTEKDALLGVSMTGIASNEVFKYDTKIAARIVKEENERVSSIIGIKKAARTTCVKPAGTTSLVLGSSSGIHAWHNDYYIRRIRVNKNESIYDYLVKNAPSIIEDEMFNPTETAVIQVPQKAPDGATLRTESVFDLLNRVKNISSNWIKEGHRSGINTHNVSATISIKKDEWESVGNWMWDNRKYYNGLSVLPYDGGTYHQAPFEDISKEEYERLIDDVESIDLSQVIELEDNTNLNDQAACAGGACEIR